jgi:two-component system nitrate/nitrite response regulator NarL
MTKHILVVDDNTQIRNAICEMISRDDRLFPCTQAVNGKEGVQKATEMYPDLVVMDYSMPVMDGLEASKHISALMPHVRIILLTLHTELLEMAKLTKYGISAMVPKQMAGTELVPAICSLLGLASAAGAA